MGMASCAMARGPAVASIAGGFVGVEVASLLRAWHACIGRPGGAGDFRAWLAAHEMRARRGRINHEAGRAPAYGVAELASLCGVGRRRAADALRRLVRSGLVAWSEGGSAIEFPPADADAPIDLGDALDASLPGRSGILAIPRRLLRFLARGARPALIASALAALLRCLSRRKAGWRSRGRLKASWIAQVFGVDARRAKAARAELVALAWLEPEGDARDQWAWNRWGRAYRIDLSWAAPVADRPPPAGAPGPGSPPLDLDPDPVPEASNPDPDLAGPTGDWLRREGKARTMGPIPSRCPAPADRSASPGKGPPPRPTLQAIRPEDLECPERTLELHRQAVAAGRSSASEADRLRFLAAAEHARGFGASNPAGLFRAIVEGRRWGSLTQGDEDRARAKLRAYDSGRAIPSTATPGARPSAPGQPSALADVLARLKFTPPPGSIP